MIRAAIAVKRKYGSVTLTDEQIEICEAITGQKFEKTWLGQGNDSDEEHTLEINENGEFAVLAEKE